MDCQHWFDPEIVERELAAKDKEIKALEQRLALIRRAAREIVETAGDGLISASFEDWRAQQESALQAQIDHDPWRYQQQQAVRQGPLASLFEGLF